MSIPGESEPHSCFFKLLSGGRGRGNGSFVLLLARFVARCFFVYLRPAPEWPKIRLTAVRSIAYVQQSERFVVIDI